MILYDGVSGIDWFYEGYKTVETMSGESDKRDLFEVPCVLEDNGAGKVYRHRRLSEVAQTYAVPVAGSPEYVFTCIQSVVNGTYKAPGVAEAEEKADAAQTAAQTASETAATARAAADEAKGAVADATSAAQTASEAAATAQTAADEAKATADTAAASVDEYMDALLGLDATNETEATDAE